MGLEGIEAIYPEHPEAATAVIVNWPETQPADHRWH
jgi:hypothetical protein